MRWLCSSYLALPPWLNRFICVAFSCSNINLRSRQEDFLNWPLLCPCPLLLNHFTCDANTGPLSLKNMHYVHTKRHSVEYLIPFVDCVLGRKVKASIFTHRTCQKLQFLTKSVWRNLRKKLILILKAHWLHLNHWLLLADSVFVVAAGPHWRSKTIPFTTYSKHFCFYCAITYITRQRGQPDNKWKKDFEPAPFICFLETAVVCL